MPVLQTSGLDDAVCVWLDEAIAILEQRECLFWPHQRDITLPEAIRASLFAAVKKFIESNESCAYRRRTIKFPTSVISRVQNAISHLGQFAQVEQTPRNVVFLPMSVSELAHQIPVAQALKQSDRTYAFAFSSVKWSSEIPLSGIEVLPHSKALQSRLLCARLRARVMWLRLGREGTLDLPPLRFSSRDFDLNGVMLDTFLASVHAAFKGHAFIKYVIEAATPRLIVVSDELKPQRRVIVSVAKRAGIRCVDLVGHLQENPIDSYRMCDRFVVFGNYAKRVLLASGLDAKKIKTCGAPYLDALQLHKPAEFLTRSDIQASKTRFVIADLNDRWAPVMVRVAERLPDCFVLFLARKNQPALRKVKNFKLMTWGELSSSKYATCLKAADVILSDRIRSSIEAIGIGKHIVAVDFGQSFDDREFLKTRISPIAQDESELVRVLSNPIHEVDAHSRQLYEDYFSRRDGQAGQRVASVIMEECQK